MIPLVCLLRQVPVTHIPLHTFNTCACTHTHIQTSTQTHTILHVHDLLFLLKIEVGYPPWLWTNSAEKMPRFTGPIKAVNIYAKWWLTHNGQLTSTWRCKLAIASESYHALQLHHDDVPRGLGHPRTVCVRHQYSSTIIPVTSLQIYIGVEETPTLDKHECVCAYYYYLRRSTTNLRLELLCKQDIALDLFLQRMTSSEDHMTSNDPSNLFLPWNSDGFLLPTVKSNNSPGYSIVHHLQG